MAFFDGSAEITFEDMGRKYALCASVDTRLMSNPNAKVAWRRLSPSIIADSNSLHRRLQRANVNELRQLLARVGVSLHSLDQKQLFIRAEELLQAGRLDLYEWSGGVSAGTGLSGGGGAPKTEVEECVRPMYVRSPVDLVVSKPPAPPPPKAKPSLSPQEQAGVLTAAAQFGAPFCELCMQ